MTIDLRRSQTIHRIKIALLLAMSMLVALSLYQAAIITSINLKKLNTWPRQPAIIINLAHEDTVEVEVSRVFVDSLSHQQMSEDCFVSAPDKSCLIVPRTAYAWLSLFDDVELIQNPTQADELTILSQTGLWLPVLGYALTILLLVWISYRLKKSGWGEDRTWFNGRWLPSQQAPVRIDFGTLNEEIIREPPVDKKGLMIVGLIFLIIAVITLPGAVMHLGSSPFQAILAILFVLSFFFLIAYSTLATATRHIYQEENGLVDTNLFGIKRLPWREVGKIERVNLIQRARTRHGHSRPGFNHYVYVVSDLHGQKILNLSHHMAPADAFDSLLSRLHEHSKIDNGQAGSQAEIAQEWQRMSERMTSQPKSLFDRSHRGLLIALSLMLSPFLLGTGYMIYQSLWFIYGAERAQGQIIEITQEGLPTLVVEYQTNRGETLRLASDGSESYGSFHVGQALTVYYDAENPENARLDLFLELWLWPIVMTVITSIVTFIVIMIAKAMTKPMPGMS